MRVQMAEYILAFVLSFRSECSRRRQFSHNLSALDQNTLELAFHRTSIFVTTHSEVKFNEIHILPLNFAENCSELKICFTLFEQ